MLGGFGWAAWAGLAGGWVLGRIGVGRRASSVRQAVRLSGCQAVASRFGFIRSSEVSRQKSPLGRWVSTHPPIHPLSRHSLTHLSRNSSGRNSSSGTQLASRPVSGSRQSVSQAVLRQSSGSRHSGSRQSVSFKLSIGVQSVGRWQIGQRYVTYT